jgi:UDP-N-acetylmuramoylalanine--D-glutamate ligase
VSEVPLGGTHNRANVAAALAALWAAGGAQVLERRADVARAVREFESLPHRLELVAEKNGVRWINDSQATIPEAAVAALRAFPAPVVLIAGGRNKLGDAGAFQVLARALVESGASLVTIGEAGPQIARAARAAGLEKSRVVEAGEMSAAVRAAAKMSARAGTVVMSPACASFDQFASFEERGQVFRNLVLAL